MGQQHRTPQQTTPGNSSGGQSTNDQQQDAPVSNSDIQQQLQVQNMKTEANQTVGNWYTETLDKVDESVTNIRNASERYIDFDESGTAQFKALLGAVGAVAGLATFGTAGAVISLGCALLGAVADVSGGKSGKIAALATQVQTKRDSARQEAQQERNGIQTSINGASTVEELQAIQRSAAQLPAIEDPVDENIIYRDMLLTRAEQGGNNISGSQWNVNNMSVWGEAPWYHSWDWGSPGWINGRDIADELNTLAENDPSTRKDVRIN